MFVVCCVVLCFVVSCRWRLPSLVDRVLVGARFCGLWFGVVALVRPLSFDSVGCSVLWLLAFCCYYVCCVLFVVASYFFFCCPLFVVVCCLVMLYVK